MMVDDVEATLNEAGRQGLLQDEALYPKQELITTFTRLGLDDAGANTFFTAVRNAAKLGNSIGSISVNPVGERRGRKYRFRGLPGTETPGQSHGKPRPKVDSPTPAPATKRSAVTRPGRSNASVAIHFGDNLPLLRSLPSGSFDLIYIDPPFNTGKKQSRTRIRTVRDEETGDRTGFQGNRYRTERLGTLAFSDAFGDFLSFMEPRLSEAKRLLKPEGSFFFHIDYRESHYCKVLLDDLFGRRSFMNEIIWAYDFGGRSKRKWSAKHDTIFWYANNPKSYTFDFDAMDRIPYMAPGLVGKEKAARGKTPTDVWWHTIVPTNGKERTGYPTQKPLGIMNRIIKVHSRSGDSVLDFFAGSGTTAEAAVRLGRNCTLVDNNVEAMKVIAQRLSFANTTFHGWAPASETREPKTNSAHVSEPRATPAVQQDLF
jgi:site-specific DNA-methyltransferase (adenine-specific)